MAHSGSEAVARKVRARLEKKTGGGKHILIRSIWILITRRCPFECRHCYFCGSATGESLSTPGARAAVRNLPRNVESIGISGGEVFTRQRTLREALAVIREQEFPALKNVTVQTTGHWARERKQIVRVLTELRELGLTTLNVFGHDRWHWERGVDRLRQELLVEVAKTELGFVDLPEGLEGVEACLDPGHPPTVKLGETGPVLPLGRAAWATKPRERKELPPGPRCPCRPFLHLDPDGYYLTVNYNGEVHHCLFQLAKPLGDALHEPVAAMLKRGRRRRYFQVLEEGTLADFAVELCGWTRKAAREAAKSRPTCVFCFELQKALLAEDPARPVLHQVIEDEHREFQAGNR